MRVIGGSARGRRLSASSEQDVRPTSDRVKESIFDVLDHLGAVRGARVLDLFAGTGALGIEALSRGAASVTFVESSRRVAPTITANLESVGLGENAQVVVAEARSWCRSASGEFDLAIADPPYAYEEWPDLLAVLPGQTVVLETGQGLELPDVLELHRVYRYGTTLVTVAHRVVGDVPEAQ